MLIREQDKGISLRTIHLCLIIGAAIICSLMLFATYQLSASFSNLSEKSELHVELRKAAQELMDASDYLTEKVQRYSVLGKRYFLDEYFEEAFVANRREEAIERMSLEADSAEALKKLPF